jgi:hypothetical protein
VYTQKLQDFGQVLSVLIDVLTVNQNVIKKDKHELPQVGRKDTIHQLLKCGRGV